MFVSSGLETFISFPSNSTFIFGWMSLSRLPLGPFTVMCCPSIFTSTPSGTVTGIFPILDMFCSPSFFVYYQIYARTSPPNPAALAALSVIIPLDVEIKAIPNPFNTCGNSSFDA